MVNSRPVTSQPNSMPKEKQTEQKGNPALEQEFTNAAKSAKSNLAKFVFNPQNRGVMAKLLASKPATELVHDLNQLDIKPAQLEQFKIFTFNQNEYRALFELPPAKWMAILLEEKITGDDLAALIGSSDMFEGAVSGVLNVIDELPDPRQRVRILFYLNHSADASDDEIDIFLKSINFPNEDAASINALHHILHNTREEVRDGLSSSTHAATESILRIKPDGIKLKPEDQARVNGAMRIMKACLHHHYEKALKLLSPSNRITIQLEEDEFLAQQLDRATAIKLNEELNGELSSRRDPEHNLPDPSGVFFIFPTPNSMLAMAILINALQFSQEAIAHQSGPPEEPEDIGPPSLSTHSSSAAIVHGLPTPPTTISRQPSEQKDQPNTHEREEKQGFWRSMTRLFTERNTSSDEAEHKKDDDNNFEIVEVDGERYRFPK